MNCTAVGAIWVDSVAVSRLIAADVSESVVVISIITVVANPADIAVFSETVVTDSDVIGKIPDNEVVICEAIVVCSDDNIAGSCVIVIFNSVVAVWLSDVNELDVVVVWEDRLDKEVEFVPMYLEYSYRWFLFIWVYLIWYWCSLSIVQAFA